MTVIETIAECLSLHAECRDKLGTDLPEQLSKVPASVKDKIVRQRERVNATLTGVDPSVHVAHIQSLNAGLKLILKKLAPRPPEPPKPPLPVWDDAAKRWAVTEASGKDRAAELAAAFDARGPDDPNELFRD
jgi:hypothetical protein